MGFSMRSAMLSPSPYGLFCNRLFPQHMGLAGAWSPEDVGGENLGNESHYVLTRMDGQWLHPVHSGKQEMGCIANSLNPPNMATSGRRLTPEFPVFPCRRNGEGSVSAQNQTSDCQRPQPPLRSVKTLSERSNQQLCFHKLWSLFAHLNESPISYLLPTVDQSGVYVQMEGRKQWGTTRFHLRLFRVFINGLDEGREGEPTKWADDTKLAGVSNTLEQG